MDGIYVVAYQRSVIIACFPFLSHIGIDLSYDSFNGFVSLRVKGRKDFAHSRRVRIALEDLRNVVDVFCVEHLAPVAKGKASGSGVWIKAQTFASGSIMKDGHVS